MIARPDDPDRPASETPGLSVSARDVPFSDAVGTEAGVRLMRCLVDEADAAARRCQEAIETAGRREARAGAASLSLQERLHLGARMLHAQQSQIERLDQLIGRLESARRAAERAIEQLDARLERRLAELDRLEQPSA